MAPGGVMRILIVEDEFTSRKLLTAFLKDVGECDTAADGVECVDMFKKALDEGRPYDLLCLDIMMPNKDGHQALKEIRAIEFERGIFSPDDVKVMMVTALNDPQTVVKAYYKGGAAAYLPKPIEVESLRAILRDLGFID
tara:strand:- start:15225 stop:15641 length:417 start_codon:yes stop_codon:yes gene_type:complete